MAVCPPDAGAKKELQFDVVSDDSDHYYRRNNNNEHQKDGGNGGGDCFTNDSSDVYKMIMKEREILEKNLPENIFVRAYDKRIDLLRAALVGSPGTPCHDGLFFIDFAFPSDYPLGCPKFCFRGFAAKERTANNNITLPDSCWGDKKLKNWNPTNSTVLQLLVQLQGNLPVWVSPQQGPVLNKKPLILRAGVQLHESAMSYDENVFVASCQKMLCSTQNPPKNFEGFVAAHFRKRGNVILEACKAYMNGDVRVGNYREDDGCDGSSSTNNNNNSIIIVSDAFKASIEKLYPQLLTAFTKNGASVGNFIKQVEPDTKTVSLEKVKHGITNKIMGAINKILGLKKKGNVKA